jgi:hypothetical protein
MQFEPKHRFFKRLGHIVCNYRKILKTLAERHQMFLCYNLMCRKDLVEKDVEIGPGSPTLVDSLERPESLAHYIVFIYLVIFILLIGAL